VKHYEQNPRQITGKQLERLRDKLARLGDLSGVVHNKRDDSIIGGNQRMVIFGEGSQPVILEEYDEPDEQGTLAWGFIIWNKKKYSYRLVDWPDDIAREANIAANLEGGSWDWDILSSWPNLKDYGFDKDLFKNWKVDIAALDNFLKSEESPSRDAPPQVSRADELQEFWKVKPGDIFELGRHKLICGDCTEVITVSRLMNGVMADLVHADPPYGMGKEKEGIENDNLYREKLDTFQMLWWQTCRPFVKDNGSAYIWGNAEDLWRLWHEKLKNYERLTIRNEITWEKQGAQGIGSDAHRMYPTSSERCLFFMLGEQGFNNNADNYWEEYEPIRKYLYEQRQLMGWDSHTMKKYAGGQPNGHGDHWTGKSQWMMPTRENYEGWQKAAKNDAFKKDYDELKKEFYSTRAYFNNTHENMTDVWHYERVTGDERGDHPTPKPVPMIERILLSSCPDDGVTFVPFGGTLPELRAGENTGRIVYAIEKEPKWCAVGLQAFADAFPNVSIKRIE